MGERDSVVTTPTRSGSFARTRPMRLALALVAVLSVSPAVADDVVRPLMKGWYAANSECRGQPGGSARSDAGCATRNALDDEMKTLGWCYGEATAPAAERDWHRCRR